MKTGLELHNVELEGQVQHQEREEIRGIDEGVPDGYWRSPIFLGTILAVGFGMFSGTASFGLAAPILLVINADIGPNANYVWIGLVYTLMLAAGYTIVGRLTDLCGRRYFIIGGNALGVVGCIVSATANSIPVLIGGNVLMGLASATQTSTPAVLGELVPLKHRFAVTGVMYTLWVLPGCFGAAISYGFVQHTAAGWRNIYWLLLSTNAAATVCWTIFYHPPTFIMKNVKTRMQMVKDFDYVGFVLFTGGLLVFLMGLSWGGSVYPWHSAHVIATLVVGGITLVMFILYECYMPLVDALIPMHLFRNFDWVISILVLAIGPTVFYGFAIVWPQMVFGIYTTEITYGSILATVPTVAFCSGTCCSGFSRYLTRTKLQIIACATIGTPLVAACACLTLDNKTTVLGLMITGCLFLGYIEGVGVTGSALSLRNQAEIGTGTGVGATLRGVVATLGTTVYIVVLSNRLATTIPQEVPGALIQAGLPISSIPGFIAAIPTGLFANVPGVTPAIISVGVTAYKQALVLAYRTVFLTTLAFSGLILVMSFFYPDFDNRMPNETVAILRGRKERAKVIRRLEEKTMETAPHDGSEMNDSESHHIDEKPNATMV